MSENTNKINTNNDTNNSVKFQDRKPVVSTTVLKRNGVYFGHQKRQWNPKMKPYIQYVKNNVHIIDMNSTQKHLNFVFNVVKNYASKNANFLFIGTKNEAKKSIEENAKRTNSFYINERWLGGTLTNFRTVRNSVSRMKELESIAETGYDGYTKKEGIKLGRELEKLHKLLNGVRDMRRMPDAIFIASSYNERTALKEANKLGIPVFAVVDTNANPEQVKFNIPANDDASKSISLITTIIADAIATAKNEKVYAAFKDDDNVEILGIIERPKVTISETDTKFAPKRPNRKDLLAELAEKKKATSAVSSHSEKINLPKDKSDLEKLAKETKKEAISLEKKANVIDKQVAQIEKHDKEVVKELQVEKEIVKKELNNSANGSYDIAMVKKLREATQAGFADCKKAVVETNGNYDEAVEWLKKKGMAKAAKKAGAVSADGAVFIQTNGSKTVIVELNSQTDFVAMSDKFLAALKEITQVILDNLPKDITEALKLKIKDKSIEEYTMELTGSIGEKISLRRFEIVDAPKNGITNFYIHSNNKIASIISLDESKDVELAKDLAMQTSAMKPQFISGDYIPSEVKEKEKEIIIAQANEDPTFAKKPDNIKDNIINGRVAKSLKEITLSEQAFIKDSSITIGKLVKSKNAKVVKMVRYEVGEGIQVEQVDFAEEVKRQMN